MAHLYKINHIKQFRQWEKPELRTFVELVCGIAKEIFILNKKASVQSAVQDACEFAFHHSTKAQDSFSKPIHLAAAIYRNIVMPQNGGLYYTEHWKDSKKTFHRPDERAQLSKMIHNLWMDHLIAAPADKPEIIKQILWLKNELKKQQEAHTLSSAIIEIQKAKTA